MTREAMIAVIELMTSTARLKGSTRGDKTVAPKSAVVFFEKMFVGAYRGVSHADGPFYVPFYDTARQQQPRSTRD